MQVPRVTLAGSSPGNPQPVRSPACSSSNHLPPPAVILSITCSCHPLSGPSLPCLHAHSPLGFPQLASHKATYAGSFVPWTLLMRPLVSLIHKASLSSNIPSTAPLLQDVFHPLSSPTHSMKTSGYSLSLSPRQGFSVY